MAITLDGSNVNTVGVPNSKTAVASTSGTSIDFTSIPAGVKRITVMFNGVSTSGTSNYQVQLGDSGGIENTGYISYSVRLGGSAMNGGVNNTSGFVVVNPATATTLISGQMIISNLNGNIWVENGMVSSNDGLGIPTSGGKELSATLDRIRITTVNGTDTFDAGSINILYE